MLRRCLECQELATHRGRCAVHFAAYERRTGVRQRRERRAVTARFFDAAAALRHLVREAGYVPCAWCGRRFPASAVEVDHVCPLSDGGRDVASNLQILCLSCHREKTARSGITGAP
ncbi:HNH endonuclease signature motif containing protein [Streptomyces sp. DSM 44915]|uniref:HNH endonuclease signature motif containing protein n=1 Tax=Streptomyces chisholmiae TaxID=3075540 RepID=A0ABU2JSM8_9ACTN|nr:HNH endonuclease signature motif containing protein [Streptomyces sp. DSM 44915]MDT0267991.1 HNH endonuclease signature motif containing protein [Streptomyces sp. DSM 44915]